MLKRYEWISHHFFLPQEIIVPQPVQQVEENEQHNRDGSLPPENIAIEML